jgi:hypothetical protein
VHEADDSRPTASDAPGLKLYHDVDVGFSLPLPTTWPRLERPGPPAALVALEPPHDGFRASLVVTVEALPEGGDLERWQAGSDELLARTLSDYLLINREHLQRDRRTVVVRRLAQYLYQDSVAVTVEQWAQTAAGRGYTLTATAATMAYDSLADLFAKVADRFEAGTQQAARGAGT